MPCLQLFLTSCSLHCHPDFQLGVSPAFKPGDALVHQCPLQDVGAGVSRGVDDGRKRAGCPSRRNVSRQQGTQSLKDHGLSSRVDPVVGQVNRVESRACPLPGEGRGVSEVEVDVVDGVSGNHRGCGVGEEDCTIG